MSAVPDPSAQAAGSGEPYVQLVLWDLRRSEATVASLRDYLRDYAVDAYAQLDGMRLKIWISDEERGLWGAVYLWDDASKVPGLFGVSRVVDRIGYPPTSVAGFALEAVAEGDSALQVLTGLGRAMATHVHVADAG